MRDYRRLATILLTVHALLLTWSGWHCSPTYDEPAHLASGVYHWRTLHFNLYAVNPPLVRMVAALPALACGVEEDRSALRFGVAARSEFRVGPDFMTANGERSFWLMTLARWACIPFSLLGGYMCYRWSSELFGGPSGVLACALWSFSPNVLGHGALITADVPAAAFGVLAAYMFWKWLQQPGWWPAWRVGVALGLCLIVKSTWLILLVLWPAMWLLDRAIVGQVRWKDCRNELAQLLGAIALGITLLNLGYAFEGSFQQLGRYEFISRTLTAAERSDGDVAIGNRFRGTWASGLPIPLPGNFVLGIDAQKRDFEEGRIKFLRGQRSRDGWWYFYLFAALVKVPLGTWLLGGVSIIVAARSHVPIRNVLHLLSVPMVILVLVSCQPGLNHFRYVLPAFPLIFVWIGQVGQLWSRGTLISRCVVAASVAWTVTSSLVAFPESLAYFNALGGGVSRGHELMVESNSDWGQDLFELQRWLDDHPQVSELHLAYFGAVDPRLLGIEFELPPRARETPTADGSQPVLAPGWYAVSTSHLHGVGRFAFDGEGTYRSVPDSGFTYFEQLEPVDRAGATVLIFRVNQQ